MAMVHMAHEDFVQMGEEQLVDLGPSNNEGLVFQVELGKVKERIAELQNAQKAARQMYDAACQRLGIVNDLENDEVGS